MKHRVLTLGLYCRRRCRCCCCIVCLRVFVCLRLTTYSARAVRYCLWWIFMTYLWIIISCVIHPQFSGIGRDNLSAQISTVAWFTIWYIFECR